ncbi:hypothetical protein R1sor_020894 [Riccia sorocarpa]|uniref:Glutaredoxin domain-containing protein n=1 Tax=Riccia sorocarpa TaxID=122646 RepID=A0ABD3GFG9_9MARC
MALAKAQSLVDQHPVIVFSKSYCPYCNKVKQLLSNLGAKFTAVELDQEDDGNDLQSALAGWTKQRTVPNVFINGQHIGGSDTTSSKHSAGQLVPLLKEAGAL